MFSLIRVINFFKVYIFICLNTYYYQVPKKMTNIDKEQCYWISDALCRIPSVSLPPPPLPPPLRYFRRTEYHSVCARTWAISKKEGYVFEFSLCLDLWSEQATTKLGGRLLFGYPASFANFELFREHKTRLHTTDDRTERKAILSGILT